MSVLTLVRHGQASLFADNYDAHQRNVARLRVMEKQTAQPTVPRSNGSR